MICGMLILILDSQTVFEGALEGIRLCLQVIIPSLLPYFFFTNLLAANISGKYACLAIGLLGGYPAGAQVAKTNYDRGQISKDQAERLLACCNHAGPAFIFGMLSHLFDHQYIPWVIWGIHILSAVPPYILFSPQQPTHKATMKQGLSLVDALQRSIKSISFVCCWVFLFKIFINVLEIRLFQNTPYLIKTVIYGFLELSNGCYNLLHIPSMQIRFIFASLFIAFGGLCVTMQTAAIAEGLQIKKYIISKLLQALISLLLSVIIAYIIF